MPKLELRELTELRVLHLSSAIPASPARPGQALEAAALVWRPALKAQGRGRGKAQLLGELSLFPSERQVLVQGWALA